MWFLRKALPTRKQPDIRLSIVSSKHAFTCFILTCYVRNISLNRSSPLNTRSNDFLRRYIERVMSHMRTITLRVTVRGDAGVAGEGRVVGAPKFHSWGKCTMPLMNINLDWMSSTSSGLFIILFILFI